jgi:Fe-S oxidoreductase
MELSEGIGKRFYACLTCGACEELCSSLTGKHPLNIILETRRDLVKNGFGPMPQHKEATQSIASTSNLFGAEQKQRFSWLPNITPNKSGIVYFAGCTASYYIPDQAQATLKLLKSAGIAFAIMRNEQCCGYDTLLTGQEQEAADIMKRNVQNVNEAGAKILLTSCARCYKVFSQDYPKFVGESMKFEVVHTAVFLNRLVKKGKLRLRKPTPEVVTYHDPCNLGRWSKIYDEPRELIEQVPKIQLVEMTRNRSSAWCCGAGGGVKLYLPEFAAWTATERLKEAEATGASTLVSACTDCERNFNESLRKANTKMKVQDLNQLLAMSI